MGGTIFNCVMIILGSGIGSLFKKGIKERYQEVVMQAMGLAATALGIHAIVKYMPISEYPVLFIVSLAIGGLVGEKLELEAKFKRLVQRFSKTNLAEGLSTAILLFCIGSLSILGPVEAALHGNYTYLITNGILDGITSIVLATTFGVGIAFTAIVLFLWQGFFYLGALYMENYLTTELLAEISIIGGVLILASGLSILGIKKFNTINLLPSLIIPFLFFMGLHIFS
ncbi:DUF554 domain-containing protein [Lederbergia galactosidilytica]|uniref:Membrane protein n=1 Tax=Lederbergia galactosidilytica TaxID=217031 RepID=A0A0Q9YB70_9BACI|nr:DUF554 domain-containing protein [Lederbergia galactosidilytica]KRG15735.1 membrane protein [Virgibacillus soli]KRG17113.1 membrane protein [Lederbergia galactosidilytica]OAK68495.1 membrane protein [Lederbergia galactosidilytica]